MNKQVREELAGLNLNRSELEQFIERAEGGEMNGTSQCILFTLEEFRGVDECNFLVNYRATLSASGALTPMEYWFMRAGSGDTPASNQTLAEFVAWCRSQLKEPTDKQVMKRLTRPKIRAWAEQQPEGTTWDYGNNFTCLLGSYLKSLGVTHYGVSGEEMFLNDRRYPIPYVLVGALRKVWLVTGLNMTREAVLEVF